MPTMAAMATVIWKFKDALPWISTEGNSFFLICQTISGPRMLPNGIANPASALKWQSMFHMRAWLSGLDGGGGDEPAGGAVRGGSMGGGGWVLFSPVNFLSQLCPSLARFG